MSSLKSPDKETMKDPEKLRTWVRERMQDLEDQNERLRVQNLRFTARLQSLQASREKLDQKRHSRQSALMSQSVSGALMRPPSQRTSDDSGLTSDGAGDCMTRSVDTRTLTPRSARKHAVRMRASPSVAANEDKSSASDSSPVWEQQRAPTAPPRRKERTPQMERDSLNDDYEFDCPDEEIDRVDKRRSSKYANYVNLADFCLIRDDKVIYSDIIKPALSQPRIHAPSPPQHNRRQYESRLFEMASHCLSGEEATPASSPYHVARISGGSSPRVPSLGHSARSSHHSAHTPDRAADRAKHVDSGSYSNEGNGSPFPVQLDSPEVEYHLPPDALADVRTSLIPAGDSVEKSGYWTQMSDSRLKSLKRRYVVLRNGQLSFYRTHKNMSRDEEVVMRVALSDIQSVSKLPGQHGYAFQICTPSSKMQFATESERTTGDWVTVLSNAVKGCTLREFACSGSTPDASISGLVTRVRCGHSRRMHAALVGPKLMFFKSPEDTIPSTFVRVDGARISEKTRGSSDEYSGSSDEGRRIGDGESCSICIEMANEDPVYVVLSCCEEKEKWMYFLRCAAGDASLTGTPFEILVQRMLAEGDGADSSLWNDVLLTACDDTPKDVLTSVEEGDKKKALEIAKAVYLFVSVLMRPTGVQYHVDLAQNILSTTIQHDYLRNEFYAQLVRLTSGAMPYGLQGWKLLALSLPLFSPKQYSLLWLLKTHVARWSAKSGDEANLASYCECALERALRTGGRQEGPSRLEAVSILTRDPSATKFPHSISVKLPNGEYQVVEFDGSTEIGQCLSSLCLKLGTRPALLSGYALFIDTPAGPRLLKGKTKLCDSLSVWEREQCATHRGRVPPEESARLELRMRHYWTHLENTMSAAEESLMVHRMAGEVVEGRVPISTQLADHLAALYSQLLFGDLSSPLADDQFSHICSRFYPRKMLEISCQRTLRASIGAAWSELEGMTEHECVTLILQVLRRWRLFGCELHRVEARSGPRKEVWLALHPTGVHMLDCRSMDVIRSFPFHRLSSFGAWHGDFMVTVERQLASDAHPEEAAKERITFACDKEQCEKITLHLAEYIRCQKLVSKMHRF